MDNRQHTLNLLFSTLASISCRSSTDILSKVDAHHPPLELEINYSTQQSLVFNFTYNGDFRKADYGAINSNLRHVHLPGLVDYLDCDDMADKFHEVINKKISDYVPITVKRSNCYPP